MGRRGKRTYIANSQRAQVRPQHLLVLLRLTLQRLCQFRENQRRKDSDDAHACPHDIKQKERSALTSQAAAAPCPSPHPPPRPITSSEANRTYSFPFH